MKQKINFSTIIFFLISRLSFLCIFLLATTTIYAQYTNSGYIRSKRYSAGGAFMQNIGAPEASYTRAVFSHNAYWDESDDRWHNEWIGRNDAQAIVIPDQGGFKFVTHASSGGSARTFTHSSFMNGTKMTIEMNGNVGIGTTNPGSFKLAVNGTIRAKEIKVETGWADFVFEEDYSLRSLNEVEQYIKAHKHLPDIPSAAEVEENGVQLGDISAKLLQKIEELTLYVIEQQKQIELLKNENQKLHSANERIQLEIYKLK